MKKSIIARNFKKLRLFKNLNQSEFADLFGISRASVGSYEESRAEPKLDTLLKVADYFKLKVDDIIRSELTVNKIAGFNYPQKKADDIQEIKKSVGEMNKKIDRLEEMLNKLAK